MKHLVRAFSMVRLCAVIVVAGVVAGAAQADTFRVYQAAPDAGLEWNSVAEAFTAALVVAGDHTIQIEDDNGGLGYSEPLMDLTAAADKNITVTALVAVTITNSGTGALFRNLSSTVPERKLSIIGASPVAPITLYSTEDDAIISCGTPDTANRNGLLHLENLVLEKSTTAPNGFFLEMNSRATGQQYMERVNFKGGAQTNSNSIARLGSLSPDYRQDLYMEYVSFTEASGNNAMIIVNNMADIEAVRCTMIPLAGSSMHCLRTLSSNSGLAAVGGATVTFRDSQFQSSNGGGVKDGFTALGETFQTVRNVYKFYRPQFFACGTNVFALSERPCEVYVLGLDDSDQPTVPKVNLNLIPVSVLRYARLYGNNKVSFQHCWAYEPLSGSVKSFSGSNPLVGNPEVELINCDFTGTGLIAFDGGASTFAPTINVTNSVLLGGTFPLPFISTLGGHTGAAQITLANSTLSKNSAAFITANVGDQIYGPGSIFDGSLGTSICARALQPSAVPALAWTSLGTSGFPSVPLDTIIAAPNLTTGGRLTVTSTAAFNAAVGSVLTSDVDNEARPQPAGALANDLGADETSFLATDIALSGNATNDAAAPGTLVGTLSVTDPDDDSTLSLSDDAGGAFEIVGNDLVVLDSGALDGVSSPSVIVEVAATDSGGGTYNEQFTISVAHISSSVTAVDVIDAQTVRVTFSRAMGASALVGGNYTVSGSGQGSFGANPDSVVAQSGSVYDLNWSTPAEMLIGGDITITVANVVEDALGGALGAPGSGTDLGGAVGTAPTLAQVLPDVSSPTNADAIGVEFVFSEPVQDFALVDVAIAAVGLSYSGVGFSGGPTTYLVSVSGVAGDGTLAVGLDGPAAPRDLAGNFLAPGGPAVNITVDNTAPFVTGVTALDTNPTNAANVDFGVTLSEDVTGFGLAATQLVATAGALNGASATSFLALTPSSYTVTAARGTGDVTFRLDVLANGTISDLAGNTLTPTFSGGEEYVIRELRITAQPEASTYATAGDTVALTVGVTGGVPPRSYQWYYAQEAAGPYAPVLDATANTFEIAPVAVADTGYYYVAVSDANEATSSALAFLSVDSGIPLAAPVGIAALIAGIIAVGLRGTRRR